MPHDPPPDSEPEIPRQQSAPHIAPIQTAGPLRRALPWVFSAAAVLGLMLVMLFLVLPHLSQVPGRLRRPSALSSPATVPADPVPPSLPPAAPPAASPAAASAGAFVRPLMVTLYSAGSGKHVPVGAAVLISAYAALPPAKSATIAISFTRNGGPRSLLTLAQGNLSTASWTPALPGRYDFLASALDSRKISAFSHHLTIEADAPPARPLPPPVFPAPPPVKTAALPAKTATRPAKIAALPPARHAELRPRRSALRQPAVRLPAVPIPAVHIPAPRPTAPPRSAFSRTYHVAAATFVARPLAETLAGALRRRGFHVSVHPAPGPSRKSSYVVQTGDYLRPADAQKQAAILKQDGYPAYVFQEHK